MTTANDTTAANAVWAVIAGGGTAGHVQPALAIAESLVAHGLNRSQIAFVGSRRGLEARLVPEAGFSVTLLPGRGIARSLAPRNIASSTGLGVATGRAIRLLHKWRPAVVVSVGGYAALPAILAARVCRIPLVLAESNAVPGAANRLGARWARASAVALPETALPNPTVTGNPVRPEIAELDRTPEAIADARKRLGLPRDRFVVGVYGGSLGARRINEAVRSLVQLWDGRSDVAIRHALGTRGWNDANEHISTSAKSELDYEAVEYEHDMATAYLACDLVVCRAGATTVAELAAAGMPAILVPLPNAPGDHQRANAERLQSIGGANLLLDRDCTGDTLASLVLELAKDHERLSDMSTAVRTLARPDAADRVADVVIANAARPIVHSS